MADGGDAGGGDRADGHRRVDGAGVVGPEALPADPFLDLLDEHGIEWEWDDWPAPMPVGASH